MSILIKGMEMPEHCGYCRFRYDGICHALQKTQYNMEECPLVPIPPHRRLIDADALVEFIETLYDATWDEGYASACVAILERITTSISIPAEESENKE